eukprot:jgi/Mesvir1/21779/Mv04176-RA.1
MATSEEQPEAALLPSEAASDGKITPTEKLSNAACEPETVDESNGEGQCGQADEAKETVAACLAEAPCSPSETELRAGTSGPTQQGLPANLAEEENEVDGEQKVDDPSHDGRGEGTATPGGRSRRSHSKEWPSYLPSRPSVRPALLFVCMCIATFILLSVLLLAQYRKREHVPLWGNGQCHAPEDGPPSHLYQWPLLASFSFFLLHVINSVCERERSRTTLNAVLCYINAAAFVTNWLLTSPEYSIATRLPHGAWLLPQRYVLWGHMSVAVLYILSQASSLSDRRRLLLMAADALMVAARCGASLLPTVTGSLSLFCASCLLGLFCMQQIWVMFDDAIAGLGKVQHMVQHMVLLRCFTIAYWATMPIIWLLSWVGLFSDVTAEVVYSAAELFLQAAYSSPLLYVAFMTTEHRRMNMIRRMDDASRNELVVRLQDAMANEKRFLGKMAQEIRLPLNAIIQLAEEMMLAAGVNKEVSKLASTIQTSGACLHTLVNDVLDQASAGNHVLYLRRAPVDLAPVIMEVMDIVRPLAVSGVSLINKVPVQLRPVWADRSRLVQILVNIIGNSAKFTHSGSIIASCRVVGGNKVEVIVVDTGTGIPPQKLASIFNPVKRGHLRQGSEQGMGLSLTRELVLAMDGKIEVTSEVGHGTTVTFTLPLHRPMGGAVSGLYKSICESATGSGNSSGAGTPVGAPGSLSPPRSLNKWGARGARRPRASKGDPDGPWPPLLATAKSMPALGNGELNAALATEGGAPLLEGGERASGSPGGVLAAAGAGPLLANAPMGSALPGAGDAGSGSTGKELVALDEGGSLQDLRDNPIAALSEGYQRMPTYQDVYGVVQILSVDDDPVNQMVVQNMLGQQQYKVVKAMDGPEAISFLHRCKVVPDLILLDVMMPRMNGFEVCAAIRKMFPHNAIPVIMISAKSQEEDIVEGLKVGSNDYVTKPFKCSEIMARISTQLKLQEMLKVEINAARAYKLLHQMLPESIIARLQSGQNMIADNHEDVTILFSDIVRFTTLAATLPTIKIIVMLNEMFSHFDDLVDENKVFKVETVGDAYMIVSGFDGCKDHVDRMISMARGMVACVGDLKLPPGMDPIQIRVGMHTGPAYAGVIGKKCPRFCFFGDTVNTAARMETNGFPMGIHVSSSTFHRARHKEWLEVGARVIKGKGLMKTYLLRDGIYTSPDVLAKELLALEASSTAANFGAQSLPLSINTSTLPSGTGPGSTGAPGPTSVPRVTVKPVMVDENVAVTPADLPASAPAQLGSASSGHEDNLMMMGFTGQNPPLSFELGPYASPVRMAAVNEWEEMTGGATGWPLSRGSEDGYGSPGAAMIQASRSEQAAAVAAARKRYSTSMMEFSRGLGGGVNVGSSQGFLGSMRHMAPLSAPGGREFAPEGAWFRELTGVPGGPGWGDMDLPVGTGWVSAASQGGGGKGEHTHEGNAAANNGEGSEAGNEGSTTGGGSGVKYESNAGSPWSYSPSQGHSMSPGTSMSPAGGASAGSTGVAGANWGTHWAGRAPGGGAGPSTGASLLHTAISLPSSMVVKTGPRTPMLTPGRRNANSLLRWSLDNSYALEARLRDVPLPQYPGTVKESSSPMSARESERELGLSPQAGKSLRRRLLRRSSLDSPSMYSVAQQVHPDAVLLAREISSTRGGGLFARGLPGGGAGIPSPRAGGSAGLVSGDRVGAWGACAPVDCSPRGGEGAGDAPAGGGHTLIPRHLGGATSSPGSLSSSNSAATSPSKLKLGTPPPAPPHHLLRPGMLPRSSRRWTSDMTAFDTGLATQMAAGGGSGGRPASLDGLLTPPRGASWQRPSLLKRSLSMPIPVAPTRLGVGGGASGGATPADGRAPRRSDDSQASDVSGSGSPTPDLTLMRSTSCRGIMQRAPGVMRMEPPGGLPSLPSPAMTPVAGSPARSPALSPAAGRDSPGSPTPRAVAGSPSQEGVALPPAVGKNGSNDTNRANNANSMGSNAGTSSVSSSPRRGARPSNASMAGGEEATASQGDAPPLPASAPPSQSSPQGPSMRPPSWGQEGEASDGPAGGGAGSYASHVSSDSMGEWAAAGMLLAGSSVSSILSGESYNRTSIESVAERGGGPHQVGGRTWAGGELSGGQYGPSARGSIRGSGVVTLGPGSVTGGSNVMRIDEMVPLDDRVCDRYGAWSPQQASPAVAVPRGRDDDLISYRRSEGADMPMYAGAAGADMPLAGSYGDTEWEDMGGPGGAAAAAAQQQRVERPRRAPRGHLWDTEEGSEWLPPSSQDRLNFYRTSPAASAHVPGSAPLAYYRSPHTDYYLPAAGLASAAFSHSYSAVNDPRGWSSLPTTPYGGGSAGGMRTYSPGVGYFPGPTSGPLSAGPLSSAVAGTGHGRAFAHVSAGTNGLMRGEGGQGYRGDGGGASGYYMVGMGPLGHAGDDPMFGHDRTSVGWDNTWQGRAGEAEDQGESGPSYHDYFQTPPRKASYGGYGGYGGGAMLGGEEVPVGAEYAGLGGHAAPGMPGTGTLAASASPSSSLAQMRGKETSYGGGESLLRPWQVELRSFLQVAGLEQHAAALEEQEISVSVLADNSLSQADLQQLGITSAVEQRHIVVAARGWQMSHLALPTAPTRRDIWHAAAVTPEFLLHRSLDSASGGAISAYAGASCSGRVTPAAQ